MLKLVFDGFNSCYKLQGTMSPLKAAPQLLGSTTSEVEHWELDMFAKWNIAILMFGTSTMSMVFYGHV